MANGQLTITHHNEFFNEKWKDKLSKKAYKKTERRIPLRFFIV